MTIHLARLVLAVASAAALLLSGCGGGGAGEPPPSASPPAATTATISGVAATGAPFAGALVTVFDASGTAVGTTTVAADGSYSFDIPLTVRAPLVVEATREDQTLVSTFAETRTTRLNITPLTNLIAARLAPGGNPRRLRTDASAVTVNSLNGKVAELIAMLKPLLDAIGDQVDPLTGTFTPNGSGHDKVLDSLSITVRPAGSVSNIEVAVRLATAEPVRTSFVSSDPAPAPLPNTITAANLPPDGIAQMVADMAGRLTACYAVAFEQRVSGVTGTATAVVGNAASVIAPECRTLFVNDDPASYMSNGSRVGRDANNNGSFSGLFRRGATGVVFDQGQLEYLRDNASKDIVFSYRATDSQGNATFDTLVARSVGGKLELIGNQYVYSARVRAYMQDREFLNQPAASYISVGYNVNINNIIDDNGNPVFSKVLVTTPQGGTLTFQPSGGRSLLVVVKPDNTLSGTSVLRLAANFLNAATLGTPSQYERSLFFAEPAFSDEELRKFPEQGVWTLEFFHADAAKANVVQRYRTISRAPTLTEAALVAMPGLTDAAKAELKAESATHGVALFGSPSASSPNVADISTAGGGDFWSVPKDATAPTSVTVFGSGPDPDGSGPLPRQPFDDGVGVSPAARKAIITCTRLGSSDTHCDSSTGVTQYASGSYITSLDLFTVSPRFVDLSKMNALYYLLPR